MKSLISTLLILLISISINAQENVWERISPEPIESSLKEITKVPGTDRMIAIGSASILYTDDFGENWNIICQPTGISRFVYFNAIHFIDSNIGYVVGTGSTMLKTIDGGINWINVSPVGTARINDVFFISEDIGLYATDYAILYTSNGCQSWDTSIVAGSVSFPVYLKFINDSIGFFNNTNKNYFYTTSNGGVNWTAVNLETTLVGFEISAINFLDQDTGFVSGVSGSYKYILKTINGGNSWDVVNTDPFDFTYNFYFHNSDTGYAVGPRIMYDNIILKTFDKGNTWSECNMPFTSWDMRNIVFTESGKGLCVGKYGQILASDNWGNDWETIDRHYTDLRTIMDAQILEDSIVYIGGISYGGIQGSIYKSVDSGLSWNRKYNGNAITTIHF